jgi:hypothetical protein
METRPAPHQGETLMDIFFNAIVGLMGLSTAWMGFSSIFSK